MARRTVFAASILFLLSSCTPVCTWSDSDPEVNGPYPFWLFNAESFHPEWGSMRPFPHAIVESDGPTRVCAYVDTRYFAEIATAQEGAKIETIEIVGYLIVDGRQVARSSGGPYGDHFGNINFCADVQFEPNSGEHIATVVVSVERAAESLFMPACYNVYDSYSWSFTVE
jgi:hypothetical protein